MDAGTKRALGMKGPLKSTPRTNSAATELEKKKG